MHIYAFIVLHMHLNAFLAYICRHMYIFTHIYAHLHTLIHEDTTILDSVPITMHMGA